MTEIENSNFNTYFYERFQLPNRWQSFTPVVRYLNQLKANQRFNLLFPILQNFHEDRYDHQKVAAGLMMKLDALCPITIPEAVIPVLDTLDLSIQEFPWFLAKIHGKDNLLHELKRIDTSDLSSTQKQVLDTLVYWSNGFTEDRYEELRNRWSARIKG